MYKLLISTLILYAFWLQSQYLLASDIIPGENKIIDRVHNSDLIKSITDDWIQNPSKSRFHIAMSTFLIDITLCGVLIWSIFHNHPRPIFLFMTGIIIRQICQFINKLPPPDGMIWYDPGYYTLFIVYEVQYDFFFSGHTLTGLIFGFELLDSRYIILKSYGLFFMIYQIGFVLISKCHYFMDVYAAIATYFMLVYFYEKLSNIFSPKYIYNT